MSIKKRLIAILIAAGIITGMPGWVLTAGQPPPTPEMDAWMKQAQLGPYDVKPQDWAQIEALAKKEGEVIIYSEGLDAPVAHATGTYAIPPGQPGNG